MRCNDDMHIPGQSQDEVDAVVRNYEVTLTWYIYDGHEFDICPEGWVDPSGMKRMYHYAERYNRCLYELLMKSNSRPK